MWRTQAREGCSSHPREAARVPPVGGFKRWRSRPDPFQRPDGRYTIVITGHEVSGMYRHVSLSPACVEYIQALHLQPGPIAAGHCRAKNKGFTAHPVFAPATSYSGPLPAIAFRTARVGRASARLSTRDGTVHRFCPLSAPYRTNPVYAICSFTVRVGFDAPTPPGRPRVHEPCHSRVRGHVRDTSDTHEHGWGFQIGGRYDSLIADTHH